MAKGKSKPRKKSTKAKSTKGPAVTSKKKPNKSIIGSFRLTARVFSILKNFWRPLGGILAVYILLNLVFATGFVSGISSNVYNIRNGGHTNFSDAINGFGNLVTGTNSSDQSTTMQTVLLLIESLVIIWALRHLLVGEKVGVKKAYYHSMAPLVPFLIVVFIIILQLLPITIGSAALSIILSSTIHAGALVQVIFAALFIALAAWSIYMLSSSIFALYIVTLPNMQPRAALRSAKNLVASRRLLLIRRLLFLPLSLFMMIGIIIVPLLLIANFLTVAAFFALSMLSVLYVHTYLYSLYKELLE